MHLEDELRPGRDAHVARRQRGGPLPRHVGAHEPEAAEVAQILRPGEDDGVVDDRRRPRDDLRRAHPGLLLDVRIGDEVLVVDRSRRGHAVGALAQRGDDVGSRGKPPAVDEGGGRGRRRRVSGRHPGVDPAAEEVDRPGGQVALVLERAMLRAGVPRGHPPLLHRLEHHRRPAAHLVERGDVEGADLARAVALHAVRLEHGEDVSGEGGRGGGVGGRRAVEGDQAADRLGARQGDGAAGEEVVDGGGEFTAGGLGLGDAGTNWSSTRPA